MQSYVVKVATPERRAGQRWRACDRRTGKLEPRGIIHQDYVSGDWVVTSR
jgi:hypothetical protein